MQSKTRKQGAVEKCAKFLKYPFGLLIINVVLPRGKDKSLKTKFTP